MMRLIVQEVRMDQGFQLVRKIAEWALPDTLEPMELGFTQLATPDTTKVCTYRIGFQFGTRMMDSSWIADAINEYGDMEELPYLSTDEAKGLARHIRDKFVKLTQSLGTQGDPQ